MYNVYLTVVLLYQQDISTHLAREFSKHYIHPLDLNKIFSSLYRGSIARIFPKDFPTEHKINTGIIYGDEIL